MVTDRSGARRRLARIVLGVALAVVPSALLIWIVRSPPAAPVPAATAPAAPAPQIGAARPMMPGSRSTGAVATGVTVRVSLAPSLSDWPDAARIHVFARRPGERMPLAVERYRVDELPVSLSFSAPEDGGALELVARLSRSGNVTFDDGDLEAVAKGDPGAGGVVELVLAPRGDQKLAR